MLPSGITYSHGHKIWRKLCLHIFFTTQIMEKVCWWHLFNLTQSLVIPSMIFKCFNTVTTLSNLLVKSPHNRYHFWISWYRYTKKGKLNTRLFTNPADRHIYLNCQSEHLPSVKKSITYLQFLRLKECMQSYSICWKLKYICIIPTRIFCKHGINPAHFLENNYYPPRTLPLKQGHHSCWSQPTEVPTPISRKSFSDMGLNVVALVPPGNWKKRIYNLIYNTPFT